MENLKKVIITGANSGLGFETAKKVARDKNYEVILACRNSEKAEKAVESIKQDTGNNNIYYKILDTSSLKSIKDFADSIIKSNEKIDVLVNNAGISSMGHSGLTEDGFEVVFATNYIGHFLLTNLLIPNINDGGKIFNISSDMHNPPTGIKWKGAEELFHPKNEDKAKYSYSKLCMIYLTHSLYNKLKEENRNILVNSFNPGYMSDTNFSPQGKAGEIFVKTTMPNRLGNLDASSTALSTLILDNNLKTSNEYFDRSTNTIKSSDLSYDEKNEKELWDASVKYCKNYL